MTGRMHLGNQHTNGVKREDPVICPRSKAVLTNRDYVPWRAQFELAHRGLSLNDLEVGAIVDAYDERQARHLEADEPRHVLVREGDLLAHQLTVLVNDRAKQIANMSFADGIEFRSEKHCVDVA